MGTSTVTIGVASKAPITTVAVLIMVSPATVAARMSAGYQREGRAGGAAASRRVTGRMARASLPQTGYAAVSGPQAPRWVG